jgi:hypothetical protein
MGRSFRVLAFAAAAAAGAVAGAAARTVTGLVRIEGAAAARGAWVVLLDSLGEQRGAILTDTAGRFFLRAPVPGLFRVRAQLIGHADALSGAIDLGPGQAESLSLVLKERALPLAAITVEAERRCEASPAAGAAALLWEEIRKALVAVRLTGRGRLAAYRVVRFERALALDGSLKWERQDTIFSRGERPFSTPPPQQLVDKGYVQGDEAPAFYAPDADVLLSDAFAGTHCFRVRRGRDETATMAGLGFEPNADRHIPDVEGTLWVDTATSALRYLQFGYTGIDYGLRTRELGGRLDFARLPSGAWIVARWWLRAPVLHAPRASTGGGIARRSIGAFMEAGARVLEMTSASGSDDAPAR